MVERKTETETEGDSKAGEREREKILTFQHLSCGYSQIEKRFIEREIYN